MMRYLNLIDIKHTRRACFHNPFVTDEVSCYHSMDIFSVQLTNFTNQGAVRFSILIPSNSLVLSIPLFKLFKDKVRHIYGIILYVYVLYVVVKGYTRFLVRYIQARC